MAQPANIPYTTLDSFRGEYGRVTAIQPEDCVGAMWNTIIISIFPIAHFALERQAMNPGGFPDITVSAWTRNGNNLFRRPFLVMETKKAPSDGGPRWEVAEPQLKRYLEGHAQTAATGQTGGARLYGAVAIGTAVKFYTYNRRKGTLNPMYCQQQAYDVINDAAVVIKRLQQIMNNH
ncbi:hypothetical protein BDW59DRAFT_166950 [Aspergillus cavernicola]|uniref:Restriction endonuclease type II-like protein n=1 Tax=Aspergillus cavernicola TaxID=176166 RepID=A0ABR4HJW9_9EURO